MYIVLTSIPESRLLRGVGDVLGLVQGESEPWSETLAGTDAV